jgi:uncharacterized protein with NRDE domain
MSILPGILTVGDVLTLPEEILKCLTNVTTKDMETYIDAFIKYSGNADAENAEAAKKLESVYRDYKELQAYVNSQEMDDNISIIRTINITDINYSTPTSDLIMWKDRMNNILDGEDKLVKLDEENFVSTINDMVNLSSKFDEQVQKTTNRIVAGMKKMSSIFINTKSSQPTSSRLSTALKYKDKIGTLVHTIDDVLKIQENGTDGRNPREWRCL